MTVQLEAPTVETINDVDWLPILQGKTIRGVRPTHDNGPVPDVNVLFTDDTALTISVKPGVYFEANLINTLRKAQPIVDVIMSTAGSGSYTVEIRSRTFPLLVLEATNKDNPVDEFPFVLTHREKQGG
jgi:hypothetical protein